MNMNDGLNNLSRKLNAFFNRFMIKIESLSTQEKIAYGSMAAGILLILIALLIW